MIRFSFFIDFIIERRDCSRFACFILGAYYAVSSSNYKWTASHKPNRWMYRKIGDQSIDIANIADKIARKPHQCAPDSTE